MLPAIYCSRCALGESIYRALIRTLSGEALPLRNQSCKICLTIGDSSPGTDTIGLMGVHLIGLPLNRHLHIICLSTHRTLNRLTLSNSIDLMMTWQLNPTNLQSRVANSVQLLAAPCELAIQLSQHIRVLSLSRFLQSPNNDQSTFVVVLLPHLSLIHI